MVVADLFNIAVNYFDAKKSARYSQVLVVTEFVVSGTQCKCSSLFSSFKTMVVFSGVHRGHHWIVP